MVPIPRSPSVTKVPTILMNNSGLDVAAAIKVAPATSFETLISANMIYDELNINARGGMTYSSQSFQSSYIHIYKSLHLLEN